MAGLTITVGGNDITAYVDLHSIEIESEATHLVGLAKFAVRDHSGTVSIAAKDAVVIAAGGATLFSGEVGEDTRQAEGVAGRWSVVCQDNNILLDETAIQGATVNAGLADSAIIDTLFGLYRSDIDSTTYVATIDASMEALEFTAMTLREILDDICGRTGGRYYVDADKRLHYFSTEVNAAAFGLSTSPDGSTTFGLGDFKRAESASRIVNRVFVQGKGVWGWVEDAASIAVYGQRHGVSRDQRITTAQGVQDRGNAILAQYAWPRDTYTCWTEKDGLAAGQEIDIVHETLGIDDSFYIRSLTTRFLGKGGDKRRYYLTLNDEPIKPEVTRRNVNLRIMALETVVNDVNGTVYDTDAPAAPVLVAGNLATGVDIDADGHQIVYINVTWGEVADADLNHYDVQVGTAADLSGYTITRTHPAGGDRQEQFRGLPGNTDHYVRVRAVDWVGNTSAWSDIQSITTAKDESAPAQVAGLVVAGARTLIGLSWNANGEADLSHYEVQRAPDSGGSPGAWATIGSTRGTIYSDSDHSEAAIAAATVFWYRVRALDTSANAGDYSTADSAALNPLGSDTLAAGCIITTKLAAGAVEADKISVAQLSAIAADLGTITAGTVTGATIRTAASGARCQMDSVSGYQAYNAAEAQTFSVQTTGAGYIGAADKIAWNDAGSVSVDGSVLVAGTVVATAFSNTIALPLFTAADGLALWGPGCEIGPGSWVSTRGQVAAITGAFHQGQGAWLGTRALQVTPYTKNYCYNPVLNGGSTTHWNTYTQGTTAGTRGASTEWSTHGDYSYKIVKTAGGLDNYGVYVVAGDLADFVAGNTVTFSCDINVAAGTKAGWMLYLNDGTVRSDPHYIEGPFVGRVASTIATLAGVPSYVRGYVWIESETGTMYATGVQIERSTFPKPLCVGDMGSGYYWAGAAHASASECTATEVNLDAYVGLLAGKTKFSMRCVFQMPCSSTDFATVRAYVFDIGTLPVPANRVMVTIYETKPRIYLDGSYKLTGDPIAWGAGDWLDLVATLDYDENDYRLYLNGELVASYSGALSPVTTFTDWQIGAAYTGAGQVGLRIVEYAVLGSILTADQVAAIWSLGKPLVDTGAVDKPGIYLYDGRFRLASRATGARTEIDVDGIKAYSAAAQSVAIETDGDAKFGSNITAAATTALAVFATAQTYNAEALGAGDVLFGDNSAAKANLLWDVSDGLLRFRGGTTTQVYVSTDGSLRAGGGAIKISSAANVLFSVASANQGLAWFSDTDFSTVSGYINVATGTGIMTIATGGPTWGTAPDMRFDLLDSVGGGRTWTAIYIDASDKEVRINGGSGATLSVRNNNDGNWPAFYAQQVSNNRAVAHFDQDHASAAILRLDGPWDAATEKTLGGYFKVNVNGTNRWVPYYVV